MGPIRQDDAPGCAGSNPTWVRTTATGVATHDGKPRGDTGRQRRTMMPEIHARRSLLAAALIGAATSLAAGPVEAPFLAENEAAMNMMMAAMRITPSGDVDADFVAMMVPHHQGAIDMARAELRYGRNEQLRRIAQEIIVTQQQEIAAMRLALEQSRSPAGSSPAPPSSVERTTAAPTSHHPYAPGGQK